MSDGIPPNPGSIWKGVGIVLGCTVGAFFLGLVLAGLTAAASAVALFGIGVVQAAWVVPLLRYYRRMRETETAKGLLIGAGIVFLLNAGCWGLIATLRP
jgi:hypothetical protein